MGMGDAKVGANIIPGWDHMTWGLMNSLFRIQEITVWEIRVLENSKPENAVFEKAEYRNVSARKLSVNEI